jgi:hypothetical protein
MYFGSREIRVLLRSLYRDLFLCPMIQDVRSELGPSATDGELAERVRLELSLTRFFGVGNPSESGVHLLYYFRQENELGKSNFMDTVSIFGRESRDGVQSRVLRNPDLRRYVFIDDICGSGQTAITYSESILVDLLKENQDAKVAYYSMFATSAGLQNIRSQTLFGSNCGAVYELDPTYRCLEAESRYFNANNYEGIDRATACQIAREYGCLLAPKYATGWADSQMLMGFHHNTPDNTINIMWHDNFAHGGSLPWVPAFKRYPKILGE